MRIKLLLLQQPKKSTRSAWEFEARSTPTTYVERSSTYSLNVSNLDKRNVFMPPYDPRSPPGRKKRSFFTCGSKPSGPRTVGVVVLVGGISLPVDFYLCCYTGTSNLRFSLGWDPISIDYY